MSKMNCSYHKLSTYLYIHVATLCSIFLSLTFLNGFNMAGKKEVDKDDLDGWVVSSESCSFNSIGARYYREVLPGKVQGYRYHLNSACNSYFDWLKRKGYTSIHQKGSMSLATSIHVATRLAKLTSY